MDNVNTNEINRRRWRNLMIAAMSGHAISASKREHLEKMRQEFGISVDEARAIADEYRIYGGGITLFGNQFQRLQIFRDMISMLLVSGEIDPSGRKLLEKMADKLSLPKEDIERIIEECRLAKDNDSSQELTSSDSQRLSRRIFRRMITDTKEKSDLLKRYDTLGHSQRRELELQVIEKLVQTREDNSDNGQLEAERVNRHRHAYLEDQRCAKILMAKNLISEAQLRPFREQQEKLFEDEGKVISVMTEMVKSGALDRHEVEQTREQVRRENPEPGNEPVVKKVESENGCLEMAYNRVTLDQTFRASYLRLKGFLDHYTSKLLDETFEKLYAGRDDAGRMFIIDFAEVDYISSAGVGIILNAHRQALDRWGDIRLINVKPEIKEIFELIGADQVLVFNNSLQDALWSFTDLAAVKH